MAEWMRDRFVNPPPTRMEQLWCPNPWGDNDPLFPAIVIPNRTRRWFHDWKPGYFPSTPVTLYFRAGEKIGTPLALNPNGLATETSVAICHHGEVELYCLECQDFARRLVGLHEQIGVSIPRTDSGQYLGISRNHEVTTRE
jgi:hypothetical protein